MEVVLLIQISQKTPNVRPMQIFIVGNADHLEEARLKFGSHHPVGLANEPVILEKNELLFDFTIHDHPERVARYLQLPGTIFLNCSFVSLHHLGVSHKLFGFCGLPTMFNRSLLEVSCAQATDQEELKGVLSRLGTGYGLVADQAGMVAPRIIARIINEAFLALEEGTATRSDIDLAMKLGTNYPWGPFEWCERLGQKNVLRLLESVYQNTGDQRYKSAESLRINTQ
jgi:3-hydroxybutyryl-CoA dehydrogenase